MHVLHFYVALKFREKKYTSDIRQDCANMLRVLKQVKKPLGDQPMSSRNIENAGPEGQNTKTSTLTRAKQRGRETILKVGSEVLQHVMRIFNYA